MYRTRNSLIEIPFVVNLKITYALNALMVTILTIKKSASKQTFNVLLLTLKTGNVFRAFQVTDLRKIRTVLNKIKRSPMYSVPSSINKEIASSALKASTSIN